MNIITRSLFPEIKKGLADQRIIVITGMRRVGKTTTLRWLMEQIPSSNKIYLDLERLDQREVFQEKNYDLVLAYLQNRGLDTTKPLTLALDEIQHIPNLPSVVKYLHDNHPIKFILTGSSSYHLKNLFSESMAGRKVMFELFPLRFGEFLNFKRIKFRARHAWSEMSFDRHEYERLKGYYSEFITCGGLPDVVLEKSARVRKELLNDIFSSYINIDVRYLADFQKVGELQNLLKALAMRIGNKVDYSKLAKIVGISRPTVMQYLEFLEKTYVIKRVPAYTGVDKAIALGKKLYFCDTGIAGILAQPTEGSLFENAVFNQLKHYGELAYLSYRSEVEMDFVMDPHSKRPSGFEVKLRPVEADNRKIKQLSAKFQIKPAFLVGQHPSIEFSDFLWGGFIH